MYCIIHVISLYHIISYHITSYHIISYHIISYHIISYIYIYISIYTYIYIYIYIYVSSYLFILGSGTPSPVMALVGTMETVLRGSCRERAGCCRFLSQRASSRLSGVLRALEYLSAYQCTIILVRCDAAADALRATVSRCQATVISPPTPTITAPV